MKRLTVWFLSCCLLVPTSLAFAESSVGKAVEDFTLSDYLGTKHSLHEWKEVRAVVVVFLGTECPLAKLYATRLVELAERYHDQSVQIVGINANSHDTLQEIGHYARVHKLSFPMLKDAGNKVSDQFGATRTPEAFLLDERRVVRYQGRIDDQYGVGYSRLGVTRQDLAVAIDELLAGKPVSQPSVKAVGCHIGRVNRREPNGDTTGAPLGDESQLPEPVQYEERWQIGEPDVVFKMPEPFKLPAKGIVQKGPFNNTVVRVREH